MRSRLPLNGTVRPPRTRIEWILAETDGVASRHTLRSRGVDEAELDVAAFYERENVVPLEVAVRQARRCSAPESAR